MKYRKHISNYSAFGNKVYVSLFISQNLIAPLWIWFHTLFVENPVKSSYLMLADFDCTKFLIVNKLFDCRKHFLIAKCFFWRIPVLIEKTFWLQKTFLIAKNIPDRKAFLIAKCFWSEKRFPDISKSDRWSVKNI